MAAQLDDLGFWVDRLGSEDEPLRTDLFLLRDDRQTDSGFLAPEGNSLGFFGAAGAARRVLASTPEGLLVSVPAGRSVESYHFAGARHGHNLKLVASLALLESPDPADNPRLAATIDAAPELFAEGFADVLAGPPADETATGLAASPALSAPERSRISEMVRPQRIERWVQRYTGPAPVEGGPILSRHIHHPDNARAVRTLCHDLAALGADGGRRLAVRTHRFVHEGRALENVEATLGGSGRAGVVLVTAHLDSTGARGSGYRASVDAAPGADDDASGVAGVLCAAETLLALTGGSTRPRRELRFVLFNAEEHGLVGSRAYAREQARLGARIVAVLQMDMIGHDVLTGRSFELHAGFGASAAVEARSRRLAALVSALVPLISPSLPRPQLYPAAPASDPAEARSNHYSFQVEGYAACLASEDFFVGPGSSAPAPDPNPNYHLPADAAVNARYAADIARAVIAAAWVSATR